MTARIWKIGGAREACLLFPPYPVLRVDAPSSSVRDYLALLKPGVMSLVVFTGLAGMWLAPGHLHPLLQAIALGCIALGSGAGGAINMWYDRDIDAIMTRTSSRPVAAGRIAPDDALVFGLFLAFCAVMIMGLALNWLAGGILAFAILFYAVFYTMWLKRRTPQNIVIGGAAGAFPPVIGWAAATGAASAEACLMFVIIFLWTPPHFWALALYRSGDYARAGVPMLPVVAGVASTKRHIVVYSWLLVASTLALPLFGMAGWIYATGAVALGVQFLVHAHRVLRSDDAKVARRMFGFTIFYLFVLFSLLIVDGLFHLR